MFNGLNEEDDEYSNESEIMGANQKQLKEGQIRGLNYVKYNQQFGHCPKLKSKVGSHNARQKSQ